MFLYSKNLPPEEDFEKFRQLAFNGVPEEFRPMVWKLLLGYLPFENRLEWPKVLRDKRVTYYTFLNELIHEPTQQEWDAVDANSLGNDYEALFEELEMLDQIDMDVRRTLPDLAFFQSPIPSSTSPITGSTNDDYPKVNSKRALFRRLELLKKQQDAFGSHSRQRSDSGQSIDLHWEAIERILYLYATLNPGISYVQGMNEVVGPIYYVLANDPNLDNRSHAEADTFFLFTQVMSEFRDHFIRVLDNVKGRRPSRMSKRSISSNESQSIPADAVALQTGIGNTMDRLMKKLKQVDLVLYKDLKAKKLEPIYFAFRWLSVLFTQEFSLPDVICIWDSLISDTATHVAEYESPNDRKPRYDFLINFGCAMLTSIRDQLLCSSFSDCLKMLQNYPLADLNSILVKAHEYQSPVDTSKEPQFKRFLSATVSQQQAFTNLFKKVSTNLRVNGKLAFKSKQSAEPVLDDDVKSSSVSQMDPAVEGINLPPRPDEIDNDSPQSSHIPKSAETSFFHMQMPYFNKKQDTTAQRTSLFLGFASKNEPSGSSNTPE